MKKLLSLLLALVMTMSLVTVSAGAEDLTFTDSNSITYEEAVGVLSGLGIINGRTDGSFAPSDNLSRGAAAKIVCNMVLGATATDALKADTAPYSDVPVDSVYAPYIAYCASEGIVSGYADGTFRPYANLSGYAFMKMLLGALGYDAEMEGYVGENWSISVAKRALSIGMDNGLTEDFDGTQPLAREVAALFALNTLTSNVVSYDKSTTTVVGDITVQAGATEPKTKTHPSSNDYRGSTYGDSVQQFCEAYFPKLKYTPDTDAFYRPVRRWVNDGDEIGAFVNYSALSGMDTGDMNKKTMVNMIGADLSKQIVTAYKDGTFANDDVVFEVYVDGAPKFIQGGSDNVHIFTPSNLLKAGDTSVLSLQWISRGATSEAFVEEDWNGTDITKVTVVIVNSNLYFTESGYNENAQSLRADLISAQVDTLPFHIEVLQEDLDVQEFKEDTWLLVTYSFKEGEVQSVEEARTVSGAVSSFRYSASVIVDGTSYYWNGRSNVDTADGTFASGDGATYTHTIWQTNFENIDSVTAVLDPNGNVFWITEFDGHGSYVYIESFAPANGFNKDIIANAYFADGSNDTIDVEKIYWTGNNEFSQYKDISDSTDIAGMWYIYSPSGDGYSLSHLSTRGNENDLTYKVKKDTVYLTGNDVVVEKGVLKFFGSKFNETVTCNTATQFVYLDNEGNTTVYSGSIRNIPGLVVAGNVTGNHPVNYSYVYKESDNGSKVATHVFVDCSQLPTALTGGDGASDIFMVMQNQRNWTWSAGNKYVTVKSLVNGSESNIDVAVENGVGALKTGVLYKNGIVDSNGYYIRATEVGSGKNEFSGTADSGTPGNPISPIGVDEDFVIINGRRYLTNKNITLVIGKGVNAMLSNGGAGYQYAQNLSAKQLRGYLSGLDYSYNYYGIVTEDGGDVIQDLYIYVNCAFKPSAVTGRLEILTQEEAETATHAKVAMYTGGAQIGFNGMGNPEMLCFKIRAIEANDYLGEVYYKILDKNKQPIFVLYDGNRDMKGMGTNLHPTDGSKIKNYYQISNTAYNKLGPAYHSMSDLYGLTDVSIQMYVVIDGKTYYGEASGLTIENFSQAAETQKLTVAQDKFDKLGSGTKADLGFNSANTQLCFQVNIPSAAQGANFMEYGFTVADKSGNVMMTASGRRALGSPLGSTYQFSFTGEDYLQNGYTISSVQGMTDVKVQAYIVVNGVKYETEGFVTGLTVVRFAPADAGGGSGGGTTPPSTPPTPLTITKGGFNGADLGFNSGKTMLCFKLDQPEGKAGFTNASVNYKITEADGTLIMDYSIGSRSFTFTTAGNYQFSLTASSNLESGYTINNIKGKTGVVVEITIVENGITYYAKETGLTIDTF